MRITRDRLQQPQQSQPLADLTLLYALKHIALRDAIIATLMGSDAGMRLAHQQPADMTWLTVTGDPRQLERAHQLLDHLEALTADPEHHDLGDVVHGIRALLHWSGNNPLKAQQALGRTRTSHPLADAVRQSLRIGHSPASCTAPANTEPTISTTTQEISHG